MVWCLVKYRDNFTFTFIVFASMGGKIETYYKMHLKSTVSCCVGRKLTWRAPRVRYSSLAVECMPSNGACNDYVTVAFFFFYVTGRCLGVSPWKWRPWEIFVEEEHCVPGFQFNTSLEKGKRSRTDIWRRKFGAHGREKTHSCLHVGTNSGKWRHLDIILTVYSLAVMNAVTGMCC